MTPRASRGPRSHGSRDSGGGRAPALADARDIGEDVAKPGGDQHPARADHVAVGQLDVEARGIVAGPAYVGDPSGDNVGAVPDGLLASQPQLGGRESVARQEAVHVLGGGVARFARVHDRDAAPGTGQDQRCREAGGSATDNHHVVLVHGPSVRR
jgi:hypothetical protein